MESGFQGVLLIENQLETSLMCRYGWHPKSYRETILKTRSIAFLNSLGSPKNEAENNGLTMSTTFSSAPASVRREQRPFTPETQLQQGEPKVKSPHLNVTPNSICSIYSPYVSREGQGTSILNVQGHSSMTYIFGAQPL